MPVEHSPVPSREGESLSNVSDVRLADKSAAKSAGGVGKGTSATRGADSGGEPPIAGPSTVTTSEGGANEVETSGLSQKKAAKRGKGNNIESDIETRSLISKSGKVYNSKTRLFETPKAPPSKPSAQKAARTGRNTRKAARQKNYEEFRSNSSREGVATDECESEGVFESVTRTVKRRVGAQSKKGTKAAKGKATKATKKGKKVVKQKTVAQKKTDQETNVQDLLTKGPHCFVKLRAKLTDFLAHLKDNYEPPMHANEALQMREIRTELWGLCHKHCYTKGRELMAAGEPAGMELIDAHDKLVLVFEQIDKRLEMLTREATCSVIDEETSRLRAGLGLDVPELTSDSSSDEDWTPDIKKKHQKSKKARHASTDVSTRQSTPKRAGKGRRRLSFDEDSTRRSILTNRSRVRSQFSESSRQKRSTRSKRKGRGASPPESPSSPSSSSSSSSSASSEDEDTSSCDSESDSSEDYSGDSSESSATSSSRDRSRFTRKHKSKHRKQNKRARDKRDRRYKEARTRYRLSPPKGKRKHRRSKRIIPWEAFWNCRIALKKRCTIKLKAVRGRSSIIASPRPGIVCPRV